MDGFNPDCGGCGGGCKMNDDGECEVCATWREIASFKRKQFRAVASDGFRDSMQRIPQEVGGHLRSMIPESEHVILEAPCDHHVLNEQVVPDPGHVETSDDIVHTTLPGCCLTEAQDEKVQEIAQTRKSEIPLHVAAMNKRNVNLKDSCVYIPLRLVLNHFKDNKTEATIQLKAPDNGIYSVGASKHSDDLIVVESGWTAFVASLRIQENDLLIFRRNGKTRLEVLVLDPSGRDKTSSCSVMGNHSSSTQEMCNDSVQIVDPPPHQVFDLSSSDDDDVVRGGTRESCRAEKRVRCSCARTQKMASTSSPCTKSGSGARKPHDRASVKLEPLSNNLGGPSQRPYILATIGAALPLPWQVEKKIAEKVRAIRSEVPIFVKVMTMSSVDYAGSRICAMNFCMEYASAYLPARKTALLLQVEGKQNPWETTMDMRKDRVRWIQRGWKEFAVQNGLKVGDVCLFQLASRTSTSLAMTVHLIRKSEVDP